MTDGIGARIRRFGNPCLRRVCEAAEPGSAATGELLDRMWAALDAQDGVGLAAPQIAENRRVLVVRDSGRKGAEARLELVNPVIEESFGAGRLFEEGCLSFPGLYLKIRRPAGVRVSYRDRGGETRTLSDRGLVARIVQHEIDHLDGRLFVDHLHWLRRLWIAPRLWWIRLAGLSAKGRDRA